MKIFKYDLSVTDVQDIEMPAGAVLLSVQMQYGRLCVWAVVNPEAPTMPRRFWVIGTGRTVPERIGIFLGTVQMAGGDLVWHVFGQGDKA